MRPALLAALALLVPIAGCAQAIDRVEDVLGRERAPPHAPRVLVNETRAFSTATGGVPGAPPGGPDDLGQRFNVTFDVPPDARALNVTVRIAFAAPSPAPLPQGRITVTILAPDDGGHEAIRERSGTVSREWGAPAAGTWSVAVHAVGEGSVTIVAQALVRPA